VIDDAVEAIVRGLNEAGVRYLLVGGLAVMAHGYTRLTRDVDLIIDLEPENVLQAMQVLKTEGYSPKVPVPIEQFSDEKLREEWANEKGMVAFPLWSDRYRGVFVDVFIRAPFDFEEAYAKRLVHEVAPGLMGDFVNLEGLLFLKRQANRPKDLQDIYYLSEINKEAP
jgi:hypothetical protein